MRYRLRTLMIVVALGPAVLAWLMVVTYVVILHARTSVPPNVITKDLVTGKTRIGPPR
jgi:hypothetical protein